MRQPQQALGHDRHRAARGPGAGARAGRAVPTCWSRTSRSADWRATASTTTACARCNPRLVYCSITGFGQTGPYRERAGYDFMIQGMGGLMSITGEPDGDAGGGPQKVGVAVADLFTGMYATIAHPGRAAPPRAHRRGPAHRHGAARHAGGDAGQPGANYLVTGAAPRRWATRTRTSCPTRSSRRADGHIILAVGNDGQFARFCAVRGPARAGRRPALRDQPDRVRQPRRR